MFADSLHELLMLIRETEDFITETLSMRTAEGKAGINDNRHYLGYRQKQRSNGVAKWLADM